MSNTVLIKCIRSDGKTFTIGTGSWRILSNGLSGVDFPKFSVYSEKNGVGDGALLSGKRIDDRDIQIVCRNTDPKNNAQLRLSAITFFNPKYSFDVYVTYHGLTRWTTAELEGFKCPSENIHRPITMTLKFYCKDGFLKSVDNFGKDIAGASAGFGFPFMASIEPLIPVYAGYFLFQSKVVVTNDGDAETYPKVTLNFNGNVTNPKIFKDEYFVRILGNFVGGDVVDIDFENCTVKKNGVNWIQHLDRTSSFTDMSLDIGDSVIGFSADDGDNNMNVYLYFNKLYLGV